MNTYAYMPRPKLLLWVAAILLPAIIIFIWFLFPRSSAHATNERIVTIHHDGQEQIVATNAQTVGEVLERAHLSLEAHDIVEPNQETHLIAANYSVNVYRARPVTIVEGANRHRIMTPHTSAKKIVEAAGLEAYDEDIFELDRIDDFLEGGGAGLKLTIKRSTPLKLVLYGKPIDARTQAITVAELLQEKGVVLGSNDGVSPSLETPISANITVAVYRNGSQVINEEQEIAFSTEQIKDVDREVGYKQVKEAGTKGKKVVTFQIELRDGKEISRKEIQNIVTMQPKKQVEIIGVKTAGFGGGFSEALAKLRSCEGKYTSVNPAGPYYGAYQFSQSTWNAYAPEAYKGQVPTNAPPEVQDQAAANLYQARGWQPWPACSRTLGLQDIYR